MRIWLTNKEDSKGVKGFCMEARRRLCRFVMLRSPSYCKWERDKVDREIFRARSTAI